MSTTTHEQPDTNARNARIDSPLGGIYSVPHIPIAFEPTDHDASALKLVQEYSPEWRNADPSHIKFVRFTEGITNTLTKATIEMPGKTKSEIDQSAILLRAYGKCTDILIDRQRELNAHSLLASRGLAPALLARFDNGLMYRFVEGDVCSPEDLRRPEVYRQVAKKLGEWHGSLSTHAIAYFPPLDDSKTPFPELLQPSTTNTPPLPYPNTWTVMSQWIDALPTSTPSELSRRDTLRAELASIVRDFAHTPGLMGKPYIFGHCDLLSGNVIIQRPISPSPTTTFPPSTSSSSERPVSFIDYEYATPSPPAFDIANHFAEWAGFACDHAALPTRSQRREFIHHYVTSYYVHAISESENVGVEIDLKEAIEQTYNQVERFRGLPGFYWGVWSLIQSMISTIDFNYAEYAEVRLGEYWGWKAECDGSREREEREMSVRERRWAEE